VVVEGEGVGLSDAADAAIDVAEQGGDVAERGPEEGKGLAGGGGVEVELGVVLRVHRISFAGYFGRMGLARGFDKLAPDLLGEQYIPKPPRV
jgi:hypothetical protein